MIEYDAAEVEEELADQEPTLLYRNRIKRKGVGLIDIDHWDDGIVNWWCPSCASYGFHVAMGPKILMPGEKRQSDYEDWRQCPDCYLVLARYVEEHDASILDAVQTVETPFENTTKIMGANPKRTTVAGQKAAAKRKQNRTKLDDDKEIDSLLKIYGDRVNVLK